MTKNTTKLVIDSCVFAKIFLQEPDRYQALRLFDVFLNSDLKIYVPSIFIYEIFNICCRQNLETEEIFKIISKYKKYGLLIMDLDNDGFSKAMEIAKTGNKKSGYPSFYDCTYHALALENKCTFITSDVKHYQKTKKFGHIKLLKDYE